jgi:hypothetical protein
MSVIKNIVLEIGGKEISLKPEEAKELSRELGKLLSEPKTTYVPYVPYYPSYPVYPYPTWSGTVYLGGATSGTTTNNVSDVSTSTATLKYNTNQFTLTGNVQ